MPQELTSAQRRRLRSLAHHEDPAVFVGKQGVTDKVVESCDEALEARELIKVRFVDRKDEKDDLLQALAEGTKSAVVGTVGHTAVLYRPQRDPEKRRIDPGPPGTAAKSSE